MNNNKIVAETKSRHTARPWLVTRGTGGYEDPGVPCLHDADIILPIVPQPRGAEERGDWGVSE